MIVHEHEPLNAEPPPAALVAAARTPADRFYVRNHGAVPAAGDVAALRVGGLVERELELTVDDLRARFPRAEVTATLQCAGNRRSGLHAVRAIPGEAPWGPGATGTAVWGGVRLADVLGAAGVRDGAGHVAFVGADRSEEASPPQRFGASVPLEKALRGETILAWEMGGEPLPALHGAPLRVVVPGWIGARSVKWLERIEVRDAPYDGWFQDTVYRLLLPEEEPGAGVGLALGEVALNAEALTPAEGTAVLAGPVEVRGYAFAGGERHVARVDVSPDGGATWLAADLGEDLGRWAWRLWSVTIDLPAGTHELVVRPWDSAGATPPEHPAAVWNPKGYVNNAWGRVRVTAS
jgi:sulfite oxidase